MKKGFTLPELMITIAIFSVIAIGIYNTLGGGSRSYYMEVTHLELQQQARNALNRMVHEMREASRASVTVTVLSATSDRIVFNTPSSLGVQYYLSGNNLVREFPTGTIKPVASNIAYLKFTPTPSTNPATLKIDTHSDKTFLGTMSFHLTETVKLRNG